MTTYRSYIFHNLSTIVKLRSEHIFLQSKIVFFPVCEYILLATNTFEISQIFAQVMILAYTKCVIIKNFQNRYFVLCTIISPACIQFQNLAKQTKVHCKYFFSIIALFYMWVQNYVLYDVYWLLFVSQSSLLVLLLLYIYF